MSMAAVAGFTSPRGAVTVTPSAGAWVVSCSCGYLVTGWPTRAIAEADMDDHWKARHEPETDDGPARGWLTEHRRGCARG